MFLYKAIYPVWIKHQVSVAPSYFGSPGDLPEGPSSIENDAHGIEKLLLKLK